jgi:tRNA (adenine37-N6)-methyltransferase
MTELTLTPIGYLHCNQIYNYDAPRQAVLAEENEGTIVLEENCNYEQALSDLEGFDKIWIIYHFHKNKGWKPKTLPPRSIEGEKKGVFATRSPYRPNPIGLSCVDLVKVEGRKIYIRNFDLLDKTPILDIKPYIPYCDSFSNSAAGWLDEIKESDDWKCIYSNTAAKQIEWITGNSNVDLKGFCHIQLTNDPLNFKKKRIKSVDKTTSSYCLSYRTWRINFKASKTEKAIEIINIESGYSLAELQDSSNDKYNDKKLHITFNEVCQNLTQN